MRTIITFDSGNLSQNNSVLRSRCLEVVNVHAPLKTSIVISSDALFVDKQLRKAISTRTKLKNKTNKNLSKENKIPCKKQINVCVSFRRKCMKNYL